MELLVSWITLSSVNSQFKMSKMEFSNSTISLEAYQTLKKETMENSQKGSNVGQLKSYSQQNSLQRPSMVGPIHQEFELLKHWGCRTN